MEYWYGITYIQMKKHLSKFSQAPTTMTIDHYHHHGHKSSSLLPEAECGWILGIEEEQVINLDAYFVFMFQKDDYKEVASFSIVRETERERLDLIITKSPQHMNNTHSKSATQQKLQ